jgi:tRNA(fMet)-specific endonuclease VapC
MPSIMLDTNIISYVLKRPSSRTAEQYRALPCNEIVLSSIVEHELRYGVARLPKEANLHLLVNEALRPLTILAWDSACAARCAIVRTQLSETGLPLSYADAMIAAHALVLDLTLVTNDQAFHRVQGLRLENWVTDPKLPLK